MRKDEIPSLRFGCWHNVENIIRNNFLMSQKSVSYLARSAEVKGGSIGPVSNGRGKKCEGRGPFVKDFSLISMLFP
jgi:hypothetical protein